MISFDRKTRISVQDLEVEFETIGYTLDSQRNNVYLLQDSNMDVWIAKYTPQTVETTICRIT